MADSETINKIFAQYDQKRENAAKKRLERINEVYARVPRIKEIDDEINMRGMKNVQNILKDSKNHEKYNKDLKENLDRLEKEKNELLDKNGIERTFKRYDYECKACSDTGYTPDGKQCVCLKQNLINEAFNSSNIGSTMKKYTFESFSLDVYSKEKGQYAKVPYENMERIYKRTVKFCDEFDTSDKSLFFYGTTGLGKTFLSCAAANRLIKEGKIVVYARAVKLFNMFEDYKFNRLNDKSMIDNLYTCDLLIIDDLGTEVLSKMNNAALFDVFDDRISNGKKMIINTNLDLKEIEKKYSARFTSRIVENFIVCKFFGEDIRYKLIQ